MFHMNKRKCLIRLGVFLAFLLLFLVKTDGSIYANAKTNDFQIKDNVLVKYNGREEKVVIPDGVTAIKYNAFLGNTKIKSVIIPNSVTKIEEGNANGGIYGAFANCTSLSSISLPNKLIGIGDFAFYGCTSLKNITLPDKLEAIGASAFGNCSSLKSITLPDKLITIGTGAFKECTSLRSITLPDGLETVGDYAFQDCKSLKSITIPNQVVLISNGTFYNCTSLENIKLSSNVSRIEDWAFTGCSVLKEIIFPSSLEQIGQNAFRDCESLQEISIPKNVNEIGTGAFADCSGIKKFILDSENIFFKVVDGVLYNAYQSVLLAYPGGANTAKFTVPEEVEIIAAYALSGSSNLTTVTLTNKITGIYPYTFSNCKKLVNINIPDTVKVIGEGAFANCISLKQITIPEGVLEMGKMDYISTYNPYDNKLGAFYGSGLTSITIPSTVKVVYEGTFRNCKNMKSMVLKEGVEIFYGSNTSPSLEKITLPKSLIKIDGNQFINTKWYKSSKAGWVYLGKHLIDYKEDKIHVASKITSYAVKDGTVSINDEAFNHMDRLMKLTVPKSVIYYNYDEDYSGKYDYLKTGSGSNLENTYWYINQPNGVVYVGSVAFRLKNVYHSYLINVNYGTKDDIEIKLKKQELYRKYKLVTFDNISFKNGTVSIANNFDKNVDTNKLKYTLPSSLKLIGSKAFENSYDIQKIIWNKDLKYIEEKAMNTYDVTDNKLSENFPTNTVIINDPSLWIALSQKGYFKPLEYNFQTQYYNYDFEADTIIVKSHIPYLDKDYFSNYGEAMIINVMTSSKMDHVADYLFGYGGWDNPDVEFRKAILDKNGNVCDYLDGIYKRDNNTGGWEIIDLGKYYFRNPYSYNGNTSNVTWDTKTGYWLEENNGEGYSVTWASQEGYWIAEDKDYRYKLTWDSQEGHWIKVELIIK